VKRQLAQILLLAFPGVVLSSVLTGVLVS